jgi:hypothetical protein
MGNKHVKSGPDNTEPELLEHGSNSPEEIEKLISDFIPKLKIRVLDKFEDD